MLARLRRAFAFWRKADRSEAKTALRQSIGDPGAAPRPLAAEPSLDTIESLEEALIGASRADGAGPADAADATGPADRAALIRQAMRIREEKSAVLANLSKRDRERLRAIAMKLLVGQPPKHDKLH